MPWIAKLRKVPKLTGGFPFELGALYVVTKAYSNNHSVNIIDTDGKLTTMTQTQARECFNNPQWLTDEQWKKICHSSQR